MAQSITTGKEGWTIWGLEHSGSKNNEQTCLFLGPDIKSL